MADSTEQAVMYRPDAILATLNDVVSANTAQFTAFAEGIADGLRMGKMVRDIVGNLDIMDHQNSRSDSARDPETHDAWATGAMVGSLLLRKEAMETVR